VNDRIHKTLRYLARAILLTIAALYFLIDLIFFSVVRPSWLRLMALRWVRVLREWVASLNRYARAASRAGLVLETVKPIGPPPRKHHLAATLLIVVGEVVNSHCSAADTQSRSR
jgi:hypothetical protein